jgi:hypothetical protein
MQDLRHRTGRRAWGCCIAQGPERLQGPGGRQARRGQRRAKRRVVLRMGLGQLTERWGALGMRVFPACATTASGLGTATKDPWPPLGQATCHGVASPTADALGLAGVAAAVLHRYLGLQGSPCGAGHLRGSQAYVGNLCRGRGLTTSLG